MELTAYWQALETEHQRTMDRFLRDITFLDSPVAAAPRGPLGATTLAAVAPAVQKQKIG